MLGPRSSRCLCSCRWSSSKKLPVRGIGLVHHPGAIVEVNPWPAHSKAPGPVNCIIIYHLKPPVLNTRSHWSASSTVSDGTFHSNVESWSPLHHPRSVAIEPKTQLVDSALGRTSTANGLPTMCSPFSSTSNCRTSLVFSPSDGV